nr:phage tail fiber assembly protein [uncultured Mediterranean phage uvMED]
MIYTKVDALISLKPTAQFNWAGTEIYSELNYLSSDTKPTETELDTEVTRLNSLEPLRLLRIERNLRLAATDWRASSDLTIADAWKTYRQSLRDLPASSTPTLDSDGNLDMSSVTFPTEPS